MSLRKKYYFIIGWFLLITFFIKAQSTDSLKQNIPYKINVISDSIFDLEFSTDNPISNLLVTVFDNKGEMVFMDCQYNFSGSYKKNIHLNQPVKNGHSLKIVNDKEVFDKRLITE